MAPNHEGYKLSVEGIKGHAMLCVDLKNIRNTANRDAGKKYEAGNMRGPKQR